MDQSKFSGGKIGQNGHKLFSILTINKYQKKKVLTYNSLQVWVKIENSIFKKHSHITFIINILCLSTTFDNWYYMQMH